MFKIDNCGSNISESEVAAFEAGLKISLPKDYKTFILKHNGGKPKHDIVFEIRERNPIDNRIIVNHSVIGEFSKLDNIPKYYDNLVGAELIPEKHIVIAFDPFGNMILLCLQKENYGSVYFANHELLTEDEKMVLTKLADSFQCFIQDVCTSMM